MLKILKSFSTLMAIILTVSGCDGYTDQEERINLRTDMNISEPESADLKSADKTQTNGVSSNAPTGDSSSKRKSQGTSNGSQITNNGAKGSDDDTSNLQEITSVEEGMNWLATNTAVGLGWKAQLHSTTFSTEVIDLANVEREIIARDTAVDEVVQVRQWNLFPQSICKMAAVVEDKDLTGAHFLSLSRCGDYNRYGIRSCPNPQVSFLGQKDIRGFKKAFGVSLVCNGDTLMGRNTPYESRSAIWYHPDSNHPNRIVQLSKTIAINYGSTIRRGDWWTESYENFQSPHAPIAEIHYTGLEFSLSGVTLARPGIYHEPVYCLFDPLTGVLDTINAMSFSAFRRTNSANIDLVMARWESNRSSAGGVSTGSYSNRNPLNPSILISDGIPSLSVSQIGASNFYRVLMVNGIRTVDNYFAAATIPAGTAFTCYKLPNSNLNASHFSLRIVGGYFYDHRDF